MSEHVSPKSRLQVAVQESKSMDDGLINTSFQVVKPSVEQPQRKRELSLSTSESELELPNLAGKKSKIKSPKLTCNRPRENYTVCFPDCLGNREMEDVNESL